MKAKSTIPTSMAKINDATKTKIELDWSSVNLGQVTCSVTSTQDSLIKDVILLIFSPDFRFLNYYIARAQGFEP